MLQEKLLLMLVGVPNRLPNQDAADHDIDSAVTADTEICIATNYLRDFLD